MSHSQNSRLCRSLLGLAALAGLFLGLSACQDISSSELPADVSISFDIVEVYREPDSSSWVFKQHRGAAELMLASSRRTFVANFRLPSTPGSDVVWLYGYKYGVRVIQIPASGSGKLTVNDGGVVHDQLALSLLRRFDTLSNRQPLAYPRTAQGMRRMYAEQLFSKDTLVQGYPDRRPFGVDSQALVDELCLVLARQKKPLGKLVGKGILSLDSLGWDAAVRLRVASKLLTSLDSAYLFPAPPVRVVTEIAVSDVVAGGDQAEIHGVFGWNPGMVVLDGVVLHGADTVKGRFDVSLVQPRRQMDTLWNLANQATLRARSKADSGSYVLQITARDGQGNRAVSRLGFKVIPAPPGTPKMERLEPLADTVKLGLAVGAVLVRVRVVNPDEIDFSKFRIGGEQPVLESGTVYTALVPVEPTGLATVITARLVGKNGIAASDYLFAVRERDVELPAAVKSAETRNRAVAFDSTSVSASWVVTDNHKLARVAIQGVDVSGSGSTYGRIATLGVGVNLVVLEAEDSSGNVRLDTLRIERRPDSLAPVVTRAPGTVASQDVLGDDNTAKFVSWTVTDNHKLSRVEIGGVVASQMGAIYYRDLLPAEGENRVVIQAWDSTGNAATDTVVFNKLTKPGRPLLERVAGTESRVLPFDSTSVLVNWRVLNPQTLALVKIGGQKVAAVEGRFGRQVALAIGDTMVRIEATDTLGVSSWDSVRLERKADTVPPQVVAGPNRANQSGAVVKVTATWVVTDNHKLKSVTIEGQEVVPWGNVYTRTVDIPATQGSIQLVATDSCGNSTTSEVAVVVLTDKVPPELHKGPGTVAGNVAANVGWVAVGWNVTDDQFLSKVEIDGQAVEANGDSYGRFVPLVPGLNRIRIKAWDGAGNLAQDSVDIVQLAP